MLGKRCEGSWQRHNEGMCCEQVRRGASYLRDGREFCVLRFFSWERPRRSSLISAGLAYHCCERDLRPSDVKGLASLWRFDVIGMRQLLTLLRNLWSSSLSGCPKPPSEGPSRQQCMSRMPLRGRPHIVHKAQGNRHDM